MKTKITFFIFIIGIVYYLLFTSVFGLLQKPSFYNSFFSGFMPTYEIKDNQIVSANKPFVVAESKLYEETMDAFHYSCIKNNFYNYDPNDEVSRSIFAFFPLFPVIWKLSMLSGKAVSLFNFILYIISLLLLVFTFCDSNKRMGVLLAFTLPTLTVFFIPYSEAVFMLSISIAVYGWKRKNNKLYMAGLFLASMTRPVFILLIASCIATEIFLWLCNKKRKMNFKHIANTCLPILSGVLLVTLIQRIYHHGSLLTFIHAQKHWGTFLQIPKTIVDWSTEGYGMNVWAMGFCFVFGSVILLSKFFKREEDTSNDSETNYWTYYSWIYMMAAVVFVLLLQGGCLHSLYRYTLCTPFFYIILFQYINSLHEKIFIKQLVVFALFIFSCLIFLELSPYGKAWDFSKIGFLLLSVNLFLLIGIQKLSKTQQYLGIALIAVGSLIWNCYLLNMFLVKAWIFL